jgi:beta-glucosidase
MKSANILFVLFLLVISGSTCFAQEILLYEDTAKPIDQRVDDLMSRLTLDEKVSLLVVAAPTKFKGIPRLGIPKWISSDGPRGPHGPVGYPCGLSMGASFDPALIKEEATDMGEDCRSKGIGMLYGPAVNIERDPLGGRFFEYFTEDPYLDAKLAVAFVQGVQSQHVSACTKHFACNNRDWNRNNYMSMVDLRTLHEIYFPAFKAAVEEGDTHAIMTAANGLNNDFCSDNYFLLTQVLKNTWGFEGFVLTDGLGTRSTRKAALAGLDVSNEGQPNKSLFGKHLLEAVKSGSISEDTINNKVRRILQVMAWTGDLDKGGIKPEGTVDLVAHEGIALKAAEEGLVLLKNKEGLLPLDRKKLKQLLVLGPNADQRFCVSGLGGSSWVNSPDEVTVLNGIRSLAGTNTEVKYISRDVLGGFEPIDEEYVQTDAGETGFVAKYYNGGIKSAPVITRLEKNINFNWEMKSPNVEKINPHDFSAQFSAYINPPITGTYTLRIKTDNHAALYDQPTGGAPLAVTDMNKGAGEAVATLQMVKGKPYFIRIDYEKQNGDAYLSLDWAIPKDKEEIKAEMLNLDQEVRVADAVVFVGGIDHSLDAEGRDRVNMDFPKWQEDIINHVSKINHNTIVVLINGSPMKLGGWLNNVPAVLDAWYGGSRAGTAVAEALFGDANPSGRLSFSWPKRLEDSPSHAIGTEDENTVYYKEGILVGYRYYLTKDVKPQFPFGYGLSYTSFRYSNLQVTNQDGSVMATVNVQNTGSCGGAVVPQLYIHPDKSSVMRPLRELKGFQRIFLKPGETETVSFKLNPVDFAFYDVDRNAWHVEAGSYKVQIGASSADIVLTQSIKIMHEQLIAD